jgi:hypothetical protein
VIARLWSSLGARIRRSDRLIALLLLGASFGLYGVTTGNLVGYEPETAGAAEGLVQNGSLRIEQSSRIANGQWAAGKDGGRFAHTGLTQPLLETPFYFAGDKLDELSTSAGRSVKWRETFLRLFNPLMAAITVAAIFLLLRVRGRSRRQALGVAGLAAVTSLIWPYAKIGMETTTMALLALMVLGAAWATMRGGWWRYSLAGVAAGAMAASKPEALVLLLGLLAFVGPIQALPRRERWTALISFGGPLLAWIAAIAWYNAYRTGSITQFALGTFSYRSNWAGSPVAGIGMLVSPGKGLLWYSPLVILGGLGLRPLWRSDRQLALVIVITFVANLVVIAGSAQWNEDTWGPRYIVASAWLWLLPIAWWAHGVTRKRVLAGVAVVGTVIQFVGVFAWYGVSTPAARGFSGEPVYLYGNPRHPESAVAYGDDGPAWIPAASEIRFQIELFAAWIKEQVTGTGFKIHYRPFWGRAETIDLTHPGSIAGELPDFWWHYPRQTAAQEGVAVFIGLVGLGCGLALIPAVRRAPRPRVRPAPARSTADDVQLVG